MWFGVQIIAVAASLALVLRALAEARRATGGRDASLTFLAGALWLRAVAALFHEITYDPIFGGLSLNALLSIATVFAGLLLLDLRILLAHRLLPALALLAAIGASAALNGAVGGFATQLFKWGYFIVVAAHAWRALVRHGEARTLPVLLAALALPLMAQVASVALGEAKASEADGSTSFIGGFNHESTFSMLLLALLVLAAHLPALSRGPWRYRTLLVALIAVGIVLANYRTTLLAAAPILAAFAVRRAAEGWSERSRGAVFGVAVILAALGAVFVSALFEERFADLFSGSEAMALLSQAPEAFTYAQQDLFSARIYLWSSYLTQWSGGDLSVWLIGFGPEAWVGAIAKYAHNSFISQLYEGGIVGLSLLILVFAANLALALRALARGVGIETFAAQVGFLLLNLATMPLWQVEGMICFALLSALTWSRAGIARPARPAYASAAPAAPEAPDEASAGLVIPFTPQRTPLAWKRAEP